MDTIAKIGEKAPHFKLRDLEGNLFTSEGLSGWISVLYFWSAECTWCERVDRELLEYLDALKEKVKVLWIASNAYETIEMIKRVATERKLPEVLLDADQQVANLYGAQTTPHFFILETNGKLGYQGAWDDVTFRQRVATRNYVSQAVESLMHHRDPEITQTQPYGCVLVRNSDQAG